MLDNLTKEQKYIIIGLSVILLLGVGFSFSKYIFTANSSDEIIEEPDQTNESASEPAADAQIMVHISGAVLNPGVYKLSSDARSIDAIKLAGGGTYYSDLENINLAEKLTDGAKVFIPSIEEAGNASAAQSSTGASPVVNINRASESELDSLPGVGPAMAKKIIAFRSERGSFSKADDLMKVPGIGQKKFDKLKSRIAI
ncbi:MAG: helix-hairpin-helix domain-containing protein [bacterium]